MHERFGSVSHPEKYGYLLIDNERSWNETPRVHRYFRMYETYGHGIVQHSGDWLIGREFMADYFASLAVYIQAVDGDTRKKILTELGYHLDGGPTKDRLEFAASVVWKESDREWSKQRYYSMQERKIGGRAKENDRRYAKIEEWMDGTPKAIYRLVINDFPTALEAYATACKLKQWVGDQPKMWMDDPLDFLEWDDYHWRGGTECEYRRDLLGNAYRTLMAMVRAHQISHEIEIGLRNIQNAVDHRLPKPAEAEPKQIEAA